MSDLAAAEAKVAKAEQHLADATAELAEARVALDAALAERGWRRLRGAFNPNATPLYLRDGDDPRALSDVLELERTRA